MVSIIYFNYIHCDSVNSVLVPKVMGDNFFDNHIKFKASLGNTDVVWYFNFVRYMLSTVEDAKGIVF